jgi:hypothetical protein
MGLGLENQKNFSRMERIGDSTESEIKNHNL